MQIYQPNFYIITGGPGAGKTTLLHELEHRNYFCVPEAARAIIQEQMSTEGEGVPWRDNRLYRDLMLTRSVDDYMAHRDSREPVIFFDRGIPDTIAHCRLSALDEPPELSGAVQAYRYNRTIFLLPPWEEIYVTDTERKQTFEEAVTVYTVMRNVCREAGYETIEIPPAPVQARADYLLEQLDAARTAEV